MLFAKRESDDGRFSMPAATWSGVTGAVRTGFPLSGKSGNVREFCFDWNVRELSGNFAVCQGFFLRL